MKNNINIVFIAAAFLLGSAITFFILTITKKECEVCKKCEKIEIGETVEMPLEQQNDFDLLYSLASKIYESKQYEKLNLSEDGMYYATINDVKNLNYDVSLLSHCVQNYPMIYFDINNKSTVKYEGYPIQIVSKCVYE